LRRKTSLQCTIIGSIDQAPAPFSADTRAPSRLGSAAAFALFLALAVVHTWPLATAPARLSRNDNADTLLNEWIVAWIAHQAVRSPARLYDANIFYPDRATLTYSEPLLVPAALGAPLAWSGASPVLAYNVLVIAGFTLTAWCAWRLLARWTGDAIAGACGGVLIAFNAHTLTRLPQLQALHVEFLPLALLAFDRVLTGRGSAVRGAAALGVTVVLQALTSFYSLIFTITALAAGWIVRVEDWPRRHRLRPTLLVLTIAAAALAAVALVLGPYLRLGGVRPLDEVALYSAGWHSYLMTPARVHYRAWSHRFFAGDTALFPGFVAVALASVALVTGSAFRDPRARMGLGIAIAGFALSFGPFLPGYSTLYGLFWPLQGIRNAARFGYLVIVGLAILAAFGVAELRRRSVRASSMVFAFALIAAATLDAVAAPLELVAPERVSPIHRMLRNTEAVVAEFPFYPPTRMFRQAPYLVHSTQHWRPMVNGYSGVAPESYTRHSRELAGFPNDAALDALRRIGVTHVFVHDRALRDWTNDETADAVARSNALRLVAADADVALYEIRR
jgi:hypothetical protein